MKKGRGGSGTPVGTPQDAAGQLWGQLELPSGPGQVH